LFEPLKLYETLAGGIELEVKRMSFTVPYDEFGPEKVIIIKEPSVKLMGFLVIDNTAPGPGKGGLRWPRA